MHVYNEYWSGQVKICIISNNMCGKSHQNLLKICFYRFRNIDSDNVCEMLLLCYTYCDTSIFLARQLRHARAFLTYPSSTHVLNIPRCRISLFLYCFFYFQLADTHTKFASYAISTNFMTNHRLYLIHFSKYGILLS